MRPQRLLLALTAAFVIPACGDGGGGGGGLTQSPTLQSQSQQDISVSNSPSCLVVGDINNDTNLDIVVGTALGEQFMRGSLNGTFSAAQAPAGSSFDPVSSLALGLLNADALLDLVVGRSDTDAVHVFLNTGNGTTPYNTFTAFQVGFTGAEVGGIALADVDDDGDLDIVATQPDEHRVSVLLGTGAGSFGVPGEYYGAGLGASTVATADFNGDGLPDLATANALGDSLSVLIGTGADPYFEAPVFLPTGDEPRGLAVADYNGDGRPDLAAACYVSSQLSVFLGKANGTFGAPLHETLSTGHVWMAAADASDDGRQDLMIVGVNLFNPIFLAGRGNGTFLPFNVLDNFGNPVTVNGHQTSGAMADFNQDGLLDLTLAFGTSGSSTVTVRITDPTP